MRGVDVSITVTVGGVPLRGAEVVVAQRSHKVLETTLVSGDLMPAEIVDLNDHRVASWPSTPEGEARQADEIVRHYRTLMAHPAVEAVTYWGLPDGGWLGAPGGLVRADGTPKPAFDALHGLIKGDWWVSPSARATDEQGRFTVTGWQGSYDLSLPDGRTASFAVDRPGALEIAFM